MIKHLHLKIDDLEEQETLWRYMDLPKFASLLNDKALWLARADTFQDLYEGRFPDDMKVAMEKAFQSLGGDHLVVKDADDFQDYLRKNTFINCWHRNAEENMVMWELYSKDSAAIAIQTTVKKMEESVCTEEVEGYSLKLKNVNYEDPANIKGILQYEDCFFYKRRHFSFEDEVRISLDIYNRSSPTKNTDPGYYLPVYLDTLIEKVVVHPDAADWFLSTIKSITEKYEIRAPVERGRFGNK